MPQSERTRWDKQVENAADWLVMGRALAQHLEPHQSLATRGIGAIGYASGIVIHDQNGLVNRVVHESSRPVHDGRTTPGHDYVGAANLFAPEGVDYVRARLLWGAEPAMYNATWKGWEKYPLSVADGFERSGWLLLKPYTPAPR